MPPQAGSGGARNSAPQRAGGHRGVNQEPSGPLRVETLLVLLLGDGAGPTQFHPAAAPAAGCIGPPAAGAPRRRSRRRGPARRPAAAARCSRCPPAVSAGANARRPEDSGSAGRRASLAGIRTHSLGRRRTSGAYTLRPPLPHKNGQLGNAPTASPHLGVGLAVAQQRPAVGVHVPLRPLHARRAAVVAARRGAARPCQPAAATARRAQSLHQSCSRCSSQSSLT